MEEAVAVRSTELLEVLASHKAVQQAKDQAKAALAAAEQQLLSDRTARDFQIQQHNSMVRCSCHAASYPKVDKLRLSPTAYI